MIFSHKRVLLVEDDFLVALETADFLVAQGCEIVGPSPDVTAALEIARSQKLDAAILDIDIGTQKVWPVAEVLSQRNVPILFLSASSNPSLTPANLSSVPRLNKPMDHDHMLRCLHAIWATSPAADSNGTDVSV